MCSLFMSSSNSNYSFSRLTSLCLPSNYLNFLLLSSESDSESWMFCSCVKFLLVFCVDLLVGLFGMWTPLWGVWWCIPSCVWFNGVFITLVPVHSFIRQSVINVFLVDVCRTNRHPDKRAHDLCLLVLCVCHTRTHTHTHTHTQCDITVPLFFGPIH